MRFIFTTFGTFGDVNPIIGIGRELNRRGHTAVLAAPEMFRNQSASAGIAFLPIRPEQRPDDAAMIAMIYDRKRGTERGLREFLFPALRHSYSDLCEAVAGADLMVSSELSYAAPLVAEKTGVPWASYVLAPFSFFSGYDPPMLAPYPVASRLLAAMPQTGRLAMPLAHAITRPWVQPVYELRRELGLSQGRHPLFAGKHAPGLVLALFSSLLAKPQPDWPRNTRQCGFVFYDRENAKQQLAPALESFLAEGPAPLVFTLGSAAVLDPGTFWQASAEAAQTLNMRAVLLTGQLEQAKLPAPWPDLCCVPYAPFSQLFPRAAVVVHQGGVGTTAQALKAGRPMLVMPYSHDQPDNAARMKRLGVARVVERNRYTVARAAQGIAALLTDPEYTRRAQQAAAHIAAEDGTAAACDALLAYAGKQKGRPEPALSPA